MSQHAWRKWSQKIVPVTCYIPGLCQLSRTGWHLSEACQSPGGTEEAPGSREAVEQRLVQEILKRCVIKLNYLQWPVCDWTIITTIIIMYNLTFSVGCCTDTLIIRNERGIYNNDINWRSRYFFYIKNIKNIRCDILIKC